MALEKQFDNNEISGANWTSDQSGTPNESETKDVGGCDDMHRHSPSMQGTNPSVPAPEQAIEIAEDGGSK